MLREEHKARIIKELKEKNELYQLVPRTIDCMIDEVNDYLDEGFVYYEGDEEKMLKHREKKHHRQAIETLTEKLSRKYGEIYSQTIRQIAEKHITDDLGYIPDEQDYIDPHFWPKWRAKKEIFFNE
jgi:hypothetical protein